MGNDFEPRLDKWRSVETDNLGTMFRDALNRKDTKAKKPTRFQRFRDWLVKLAVGAAVWWFFVQLWLDAHQRGL